MGGTAEELVRENERLREQQRAVSAVLRAVAGSAGLQPVLDEIIDAAARLCRGNSGQLYLLDADLFRVVAQTADISSEAWIHSVEHPHGRDRTSIVGRVGITGDLEQIPDVLEDPLYTFDHRKIGFRSIVGVPVVLDDALIGVLALTRKAPGGFDDDDVDLVRTFADQAAIAIANARLLETVERQLEQQRAIAELLRTVARSEGLAAVFRVAVDAATTLCGGEYGALYLAEGDVFRAAVQHGGSSEQAEYERLHPHPRDRTTLVGRVAVTQDTVHIPDASADPEYAWPGQELGGYHALLGAPILVDDELLGVIGTTRTNQEPFTSEQIDLLKTFADQAAIAIANARLLDAVERQRAELELASEHKSQFLANMSHELRTPLNAIIGFSEVLQEQMFGELNERQLGYVEDVLDAGKHLLSLINDVLDLAKIEAGKMELELSEFALHDVLRAAVSMHAERASRGGIELALITEPEEITITADERRVRQVVFNLVSNAVKFTPPQGRIGVSANADNGLVEIAVADTGPGIPAQDLETIFEEFEQTEAGKQAEGTGLGLPLSRKLAELHGGRLWAESQAGQGSTFRFTLPVQQEARIGSSQLAGDPIPP